MKSKIEKFPQNKLTYKEQYGDHEYYVDNKYIEDLKEVKIDGKKYKIVGVQTTEMNYEMGHNHVVCSLKYHIETIFENTRVLIDLDHFFAKRSVVATKFKLFKPKQETKAITRSRIL